MLKYVQQCYVKVVLNYILVGCPWIIIDLDDNGNFLFVFECTVVNFATYRQFTNAAWDCIIEKKKKKGEEEEKIKIALSLGYPYSYFYNKRCNMLL